MEFVSMRDFRTQTAQVWDKLANDQEIVITNNGRPRAFLVNIPENGFEVMLTGIREARAQVKPNPHRETVRYNKTGSPAEMTAAWEEVRALMAGIDGDKIDLDRIRAERRAAKYERDV